MKKSELIKVYAEKVGKTQKEAKELLEGLQELILDTLRGGEEVTLVDMGKLVVSETSERKGRNPQTGEELIIPAGHKVSLKQSKLLKECVK